MTDSQMKIEIPLSEVARPAQWITLALAAFLVLMGLSNQNLSILIVACFLGIVSRIAQAEHQHREALGARPEATPPGLGT